jgi:hypothetical protein
MALQTPNYFDEFDRIRTHAAPYDPQKDYSLIVEQLTESCGEFEYLGISPQNLVEPAELLPVILVQYPEGLRTFINPKILKRKGKRFQGDACGNIYLMKDGKKVCPFVFLTRPRSLLLGYTALDGSYQEEWFVDTLGKDSTDQSPVGITCHEIEHLRGLLIVDNARERMINLFAMLAEMVAQHPEVEAGLTQAALSRMPTVLIRKGDEYILQHAVECKDDIPEVGPDALFFDGAGSSYEEITQLKVPRGGELLPIRLSKLLTEALS